MSACTEIMSHLHITPIPLTPKRSVIIVDKSDPNVIQTADLPQDIVAVNRALLSVPESLARRVQIRLDFECRMRWRKSYDYKRLRGNAILCSAPNAEQAELFIQALHEFAASLNGKWLAPRPESSQAAENTQEPPTPGTK